MSDTLHHRLWPGDVVWADSQIVTWRVALATTIVISIETVRLNRILHHHRLPLAEGMPIFAWTMLTVVFVFKLLWKVCIKRAERKKLFTHLHVIVATGVVVQRVLYLYETRNTLDVFNCSPTNPPDYDKDGNEVGTMGCQSQHFSLLSPIVGDSCAVIMEACGGVDRSVGDDALIRQ